MLSLLHNLLLWCHEHGDKVNGAFEAFGAYAVWMNVRRLLRDRDVKGITWQYQGVFWLWGVWNVLYYPSLDQMFSFGAGVVLVLGNFVWLVIWIKILHERRRAARFLGLT